MSDDRRGRGLAFGLLAIGSLVGLLLATQTWWTAPGAEVTGNQATASLAGVLAGAAAAGTGLAALSGRVGRTVLGVLILVLGVGMVFVAITAQVSSDDLSTMILPGADDLNDTGLRWAFLVCGLLVAGGAAVLAARARRWPRRRDRYARSAARAATAAEDDPADVWQAMDAGFDPTAQEPIDDPTSDPSGRNASDRRE